MIPNLLSTLQEAGPASEALEYAAREAASLGLELFAGGATVIIVAPVLVIVLIILVIH